MNTDDVFEWGNICPPRQESVDWIITREFGGKWYYLVTRHEITEVLDQYPFGNIAPYDGDSKLEIP